jgi:glycosyltransferase involved in cell wall biosynthesis
LPSLIDFKGNGFEPIHFKWLSSKTIDSSIALEKDTSEWIERKRIVDNELEPIVSRNCDLVLPVFKKGLQKWRKFSRRTFLLPCTSINKTDIYNIEAKFPTRNRLREDFGFAPDERVFVSVARLAPEKGLERVISIFKKESPFSKNVLYIAGVGPLEKRLRRLAKGAKNIHFLGYLNRDTVFDLLIASDIFVLLSTSEGLPLAIQEAMAARKPIWVTDIGGNSDLVSDENGFLCKVNNNSSFAETFNQIKTLNNFELIKMGKRSKNKITHYYMLEKVCGDLDKIYSRL